MEYHAKNLGKGLSESEKTVIWQFAEEYKTFLKRAKTERESVNEIVRLCQAKGFKEAGTYSHLQAGDKVYYVNRQKNLVLFVVGNQPLSSGINMIASHLDAPRLDIKPLPLIEDQHLALLKTHYYGGVKKYQWASLPLSLHGVVCLAKGQKLEICLGEEADEPVFVLPDLLPHLDRKIQRERKAEEVIKGEEMRILIGSLPSQISQQNKEPVKRAVLEHLKKKYGIEEEDFICAELEVTPALDPKDVGLDTSLIGAYGQDDRICAYTSCQAVLNLEEIPQRSCMVFLADKEEIGSTGSTGMQSNYFVYVLSDLLKKTNSSSDYHTLLSSLWASYCLSADVCAAVNPLFKEVHDLSNAPQLNHGITLTKYTGSGGKGMASDADAEFMDKVRQIFNEHKVGWQSGLLGKVDEGGGGTVAKFIAHWGVRTLDCGPSLLSMHSPFEISAKLDVWASYQAYRNFLLYCL